MSIEQFAEWLLGQAPALVVMALVWWRLEQRFAHQTDVLEKLLSECWARVLDCMDDDM